MKSESVFWISFFASCDLTLQCTATSWFLALVMNFSLLLLFKPQSLRTPKDQLSGVG